MHCRDNHRRRDLCPQCHDLLAYARERPDKCSF
ncbi:nitrous oxide-stimulated promoter family protein [Chloroflexota bacterium]